MPHKSYRHLAFLSLVICLVPLINAINPVAAADLNTLSITCSSVHAMGVSNGDAPSVRLSVAQSNKINQPIGEQLQSVSSTNRLIDLALTFPKQPEGTDLVVTVGEWDGKNFVQPTVATTACHSLPDMIMEVYASKKLKFSIQHPTTWQVRAGEGSDKSVYFQSDYKASSSDVDAISYYVFASELRNPKKLDFKALATKDLPDELAGTFTFAQRNYTPSGDAEHTYTIYTTDALPSQAGAYQVFITRDGSRYIMLGLAPYNRLTPFSDQRLYEDIFQQMLSTFTME